MSNHLNLQSSLSESDTEDLLWAFCSKKYWKWKVFSGNEEEKSDRTECIHVVFYTRRFRNLFPHQAAWLLARGNPPLGLTISHQCAHGKRGKRGKKGKKGKKEKREKESTSIRISPCINVLHMRCEPIKWNNARIPDQRALVTFKWSSLRKLKGFKGPKFLMDIDGHDANCVHDENHEDDACFINCGSDNKKIPDGFFVFMPRPGRNVDIQTPDIIWNNVTLIENVIIPKM